MTLPLIDEIHKKKTIGLCEYVKKKSTKYMNLVKMRIEKSNIIIYTKES